MEQATAPVAFRPVISLDLGAVSAPAFAEALLKFKAWSDREPPDPDLPVQTGWCQITPEIAGKLLRRNKMNRKVSLETVRKYARRMKEGEWHPTGQPILISGGEVFDAQHRLWACYFSGCTFPSYVIADVPEQVDLFAYLDDAKVRSAADALHTAGENGLSATLAAAVKLSFRYDAGRPALSILRQPSIRPMDNIEVLAYARHNPGLREACHDVVSNYGKAVDLIGNKGIAGFVAWKITVRHGRDALHDFMVPLGSGANLEEESPILALRNRLIEVAEADKDALRPLHVLALIIKGFNMHIQGYVMKQRNGKLNMTDNEKYPLFEDVAPVPVPAPIAAE